MEKTKEENKNSHKSILKSTALLGGSNVLLILLGILRTKIIAVLIGPAGFGLLGIFQNLIELIKSVTSLGINFSGVKEVASSNVDIIKVSKSILILKRWSISTGLIGTLLTILFSYQLSEYSFGNQLYNKEIIFLSINILISAISSVQLAILQGLQKMQELVKAGIFGSALATLVISILYYLLGSKAIIPGMLTISISSLIFSSFYSRNIKIVKINMAISETIRNGLEVVKLGVFITINGLLTNLAFYFVRAIILKNSDLNTIGAFQASWTISSLYLNVLLYPLIADFFPRLSKTFNDHKLSSKLINEQLEVTILLASPIIISLISFSNSVIFLFYSNSFILAISILQWQIAATFFIIISWPLGVIFLTNNKGIYSFFTEFVKLLIFTSIIYFGWGYFGIISIGIAYLVSNIIFSILIYVVTNNLIGFNYSYANQKHILIIFLFTFFSLLNVSVVNGIIKQAIFGFLLLFLSSIYSYISISRLTNINELLF
jgi:antigen flippase